MAAPMTIGYGWHASGVCCACGDCEKSEVFGSTGISYDVGVVQGKGVFPVVNVNSGAVEYIDWLDDDGNPFINVVYICEPCDSELEVFMAEHYDEHLNECFTSLIEDVCDAMEDNPSREHPGELMSCDACGSSIIAAEPIILLTHGRLVLPERRPPGTMPVKFVEDLRQHEHVLCLECAKTINMLREPCVWGGRLYEVKVGWHGA